MVGSLRTIREYTSRCQSFCYNQSCMDHVDKPVIIVFSTDNVLLAQMQQSAIQSGFRLNIFQNASQFAAPNSAQMGDVFAEPLGGLEFVLIDKLSAWQPALILFDLNAEDIPWKKWVALIKSVSATRRLPLICIGGSLPANELQFAWDLGADGVYPKGNADHQVTEWINRHARLRDHSSLETSCLQPLSALAVHGLQFFNGGKYFEAHEALEEAWLQDPTPGREMYRAILQIAVAYLQIERGNYQGAVKMFLRVRQWIQPLPDNCRGVDIAQLRQDAQKVYEQLIRIGKYRLADFDRSLFTPVKYQEM